MTTPTTEAIEAAARAMRESDLARVGDASPLAYYERLAGAAAPFIAAQAKAEALREAADALDLPGSNAHGYYSGHADFGYSEAETHAGDWLRARAATIENKETGNANQPEV